MATYIALLRGVNVGGHRILKMEKLRAVLGDAGFGNVRTYVQSGNVLVDSRLAPAKVAAGIAKAIEKEFGFEVPVIVRTPQEIARAVKAHPFGQDPERCFFCFLDAAPTKAAAAKLKTLPDGPERFAVKGKTLFLFYGQGLGRAKRPPSQFERLLGVAGTARNWNTLQKLIELARG